MYAGLEDGEGGVGVEGEDVESVAEDATSGLEREGQVRLVAHCHNLQGLKEWFVRVKMIYLMIAHYHSKLSPSVAWLMSRVFHSKSIGPHANTRCHRRVDKVIRMLLLLMIPILNSYVLNIMIMRMQIKR